MQNAKLMLTCLAFAGLAALAGCSFPGVYKIDIQQGNVVTQDMIDQLRPGMTRRQVRFIMGNPLIVDTFHANRWDYLYSIQPGGGRRQQERVSLFFNDSDQLAGLNGDFMPGVSRDEAILGKEGPAETGSAERRAAETGLHPGTAPARSGRSPAGTGSDSRTSGPQPAMTAGVPRKSPAFAGLFHFRRKPRG